MPDKLTTQRVSSLRNSKIRVESVRLGQIKSLPLSRVFPLSLGKMILSIPLG